MGEGEPENGKHTNETQEASEAAGMSQKNNDRVRIGNRRYKIRRFLAQPRNIDVKQYGRVLRRMVVRRKTIYPTTRRR